MAMCDWCGYHAGHDIECPCHTINLWKEPGMASECLDCPSEALRGSVSDFADKVRSTYWVERDGPQRASERQVGGGHYQKYAIQPMEFLIANEVPYAEASAMLYVLRHEDKNGLEDLEKAKHTIDLIIEAKYG